MKLTRKSVKSLPKRIGFRSTLESSYVSRGPDLQLSYKFGLLESRGGSRKFGKWWPSPPPFPPELKLDFAGDAAYSIVVVFVMQS